MEKRKLTYSFALAFLLVITSIIIFSQTNFSNFNLTGLVTNNEGIECDGNWTQTLGECINGSQEITWTSSDSLNCTSPITQSQTCEIPITCSENWSCAEWTTCVDSIQTRTCSDLNSCGTTTDKPSESQTCISCEENWDCEEWSECDGETQTRTCSDLNSCNTTTDKPSESQTCNEEETTEEQTLATSSTLNQETQTTQDTNSDETTTETSQTDSIPSCTPNWKCGEWQECLNNKEIRICLDENNCNSNENLPPTSQECVSKEVKATCSDKIKNQGELNVDCGGPCKKCGIFTLVGNVISGDTNKEGSLLKVLTSILTIIVIAVFASFLVFFLKSKKKGKITLKKNSSKK